LRAAKIAIFGRERPESTDSGRNWVAETGGDVRTCGARGDRTHSIACFLNDLTTDAGCQMTGEKFAGTNSTRSDSVTDWLLDADPSIRWQVRRDLLRESDEAVAAERARVAFAGWGARLLQLQGPDGHWGPGGTYDLAGWMATTNTLFLLRDFGLDPASQPAQQALRRVRDHCTWGPEWGNAPFFAGEVEPCINGRVLAAGAYFGEADDQLLERLLREQLADGGWNCEAPKSTRSSFHTTICVLEGLLAYEHAKGASAVITQARQRGEEYLLERRLFRSLSTGAVIDADWTLFSYPTRYHYDVLWGLDYLRRAGVAPDDRVTEAVELVRRRQDGEGRWPLENPHEGSRLFDMEDGPGRPSRWNTLRAIRVLEWAADKK
jgi:hypothetical protein